MKVVTLLSGGMDSTTLAYELADAGHEVHALAVDYGQRHRARELNASLETARRLGFMWNLVDLRTLTEFLSGSALTDPENVEVPEGHYTAETMKATVVPNRNAIMLNIAVGVAVARGAELVATAVHAGDHAVYPDCRPEFIDAMNELIPVATEGFSHPGLHVHAPFVNITKEDIAKLGERLGVPWELTWSCYVGGELHCGKCGTCVERAEALHLAGIEDPTEYVDADYWRSAVALASGA